MLIVVYILFSLLAIFLGGILEMSALLSLVGLLVNGSVQTEVFSNFQDIGPLLQVKGGVRQFSVLYRPEQSAIAGQLHTRVSLPVTLNCFQTPLWGDVDYRTPNNVILMLDDNLTVEFVLNNTIRYHDTAYVAVCDTEECIAPRLREFWKNNIIAGYVFLANGSSVNLYGFEPTRDDILVLSRPTVTTIEVFDLHQSRMNVSVVNLAPAVILDKNDDTKSEGVEARLMLEIARKFNMEPHFAMPRDGEWWGWINPKATGVVGEVLSRYSGFGFGVLAITDSRLKVLDQLAGYNPMECVTWAVPRGAGPAAAPWVAMLVTEFSTNTWFAMAVCSFLVILASKWVERLHIGPTLFRIYALAIGLSVNLPAKASARVLLLTWIWASFILAVAYQASMGSKLAVPPTNPDINTFLDLIQSNLEITGFYNSIRLIKGEDPVIQAIAKRSVPTTMTIAEAFARLVSQRDIAYMRQKTTFKYTAILDPDSLEDIHIMTDCAFSYYPSLTLDKWSPFYRGTQKVMRRLFESGLTVLWGSRLMPDLPPVRPPVNALDLKRLLGAFAVLGVGLGMASGVFVVEKVISHGIAFGTKKKAKTEWQAVYKKNRFKFKHIWTNTYNNRF